MRRLCSPDVANWLLAAAGPSIVGIATWLWASATPVQPCTNGQANGSARFVGLAVLALLPPIAIGVHARRRGVAGDRAVLAGLSSLGLSLVVVVVVSWAWWIQPAIGC